MQVVLDLNLFVSALIGGPATRALLDEWRARRFVLILSDQLLAELLAVLARPKFTRYFSENDIQELADLIRVRAVFIEPTIQLELCRDPKDNILLEIAATAQAQYIVTGDKDLLDDSKLRETMLEQYNVLIVTPTALLTALAQD